MFKIAWRNVLRNKRRSFLSLTIIVIGVIVLFLFNGYMSFCLDGLATLSVEQYGNIQIAKKGFWDNRDDKRYLIEEQDIQKTRSILLENKDIKTVSSELGITGIIGTETKSVITVGRGIEPGKRRNQNIRITSGINIFASDTDKVLLGEGIYRRLGIKDDDWVSVLTTTLDGANNAGSLQISGSFSTGNADADNSYIFLPVKFAQDLLNTKGIDKFVIDLEDTKLTDSTIEWLKKRFTSEGIDVEVKSWLQLDTYFRQVKGVYQTVFMFMSTIIFILVFFSILEIMSMAFFERLNEIGTIRAIGTKSSEVFKMLGLEGVILGIIGGLAGIILGWGIGLLINELQITYSAPNFSQPVPLYINLSINNGLLPFFIVVFAITISAVFPGLKASKLNIVEVLRHL